MNTRQKKNAQFKKYEEIDLTKSSSSQISKINVDRSNEFDWDLMQLRNQNILMRSEFQSPIKVRSDQTSMNSSMSNPSFTSSHSLQDQSQDNSDDRSRFITRPLNKLSLLPRPQRVNVLKTLIKAFPVTVPKEDFAQSIDWSVYSDYTEDMNRYFMERKDQHISEFDRHISVFKSERPWEPKWFINVLSSLIVSTKSRPNIYQYIFNLRAEETKDVWSSTSLNRNFIKWLLLSTAMVTYFISLFFIIGEYGENGLNMSVPFTLIVAILINKMLIANSDLPRDM